MIVSSGKIAAAIFPDAVIGFVILFAAYSHIYLSYHMLTEVRLSYSKYPSQIDSSLELPPTTDNITPVKAEVVNRLRDAILAIEAELGVDPSREFGSVRDRIDNLTTLINRPEFKNYGFYLCSSLLEIGQVVYLSASDTVAPASAADGSMLPILGIVVSKLSPILAMVCYAGEISVLSGLVPGATYFLSLISGGITITPPATTGNIIQSLGVARNDNTFIVAVNSNYFIV